MKFFVTVILVGFFCWSAAAQSISREVIAICGGSSAVGEVHLSWTGGEALVQTIGNERVTLTEGFQQECRYTITALQTVEELQISVYPNPVADNLFLKNSENLNLQYMFYNINGNVLTTGNTTTDLQSINCSSFAAGTYLLKVVNTETKAVKTFKILKQ